jgi:hypothetical protein
VLVSNGQREKHAAGDALVGSGIAEGLAAEHVRAGSDLDAKDARVELWHSE